MYDRHGSKVEKHLTSTVSVRLSAIAGRLSVITGNLSVITGRKTHIDTM